MQALSGGRVRFQFEGLAHTHSPSGATTGEASGTLLLHQNVAVYKAREGKARLILRFAPRLVFISQVGDSVDLEFGMGVEAGGIYKKTSSQPPKFGPVDH